MCGTTCARICRTFVDDLTHKDRAILVHQRQRRGDESESVAELQLLVESAGAEICELMVGQRSSPDPATYIGKGKAQELREMVSRCGADFIVVNHDISPVQERNLERTVDCRVLDRTSLILDIFAQRAASHEGKLQVELAQLRHLSTRLVRGWTHLERQKGGIGLRGPGETQLETDRRLIGRRIKTLKRRLERVSSQRGLRRKSRHKVPIPTVSLAGYTNAGKSSLFNQLTGSDVFIADQLFATLDPTMRRLEVPGFGPVVLSDTVGFIRDLPHSLVKAFHSTLEEVANADLLLHVVDIGNSDRRECMHQVERVLADIGADEIPVVVVYNKIDVVGTAPRYECNAQGLPDKVWLSAQTGAGVDLLGHAISLQLGRYRRSYRIRLPARQGRLRAQLFQRGNVLREQIDAQGGWILDVEMSEATSNWMHRQREFDKSCVVESLPDLREAAGA